MNAFRIMLMAAALAGATQAVAQSAPVITRSTISLATARKMLAAAEAEAQRNKVDVSIIIVDERGAIILAERMDGAGYSTFDIATAKAKTAADLKVATADLGQAVKAGMTELTTLGGHLSYGGVAIIGGGVPVKYRNQFVGGIAASGAAPEVDAKIASAGAAILGDQK